MKINEKKVNDLIDSGVQLLNFKLTRYKNMDDAIYFGFLIQNLLKYSDLNIEQRVVLERLMAKLNTELYIFEIVCNYAEFYYLPTKVYGKDSSEISKNIRKSNLLIDIFRLRVLTKSVSGNSDDEYFFSRGLEYLLRGINNFYTYCKDEDFNKMGMYFLFLNYVQTIVVCEENKNDIKVKKLDLRSIVDKIKDMFQFIEPKMNHIISLNDKLCFFNLNVKHRFNVLFGNKLEVDFESEKHRLDQVTDDNLIWILSNLIDMFGNEYEEKFKLYYTEKFGENFTRYKEKVILEINYLKSNKGNKINLVIPKFENYISRNWFSLDTYFANYERSYDQIINEEDVKKTESMNDSNLRKAIASIVINIDKHIIKRESEKPHGAHEISDMELPLRYNDDTFYLCLPFKSGKEISTKKVSESYLYQVVKPFTSFGDRAIVLFISAKDGTENFYNAIKRMNILPLFKIETLMGENLVKLLKVNNII